MVKSFIELNQINSLTWRGRAPSCWVAQEDLFAIWAIQSAEQIPSRFPKSWIALWQTKIAIGITHSGWWFQPLWKILVNGKDYPIYYGKYKKSSRPPTSICSWFRYSKWRCSIAMLPKCSGNFNMFGKSAMCNQLGTWWTSRAQWLWEKSPRRSGDIQGPSRTYLAWGYCGGLGAWGLAWYFQEFGI